MNVMNRSKTGGDNDMLWRYPVRLATLLLSSSRPELAISKIEEFASTYDDLEKQSKHIPGLIATVWRGGVGKDRPYRYRRQFERDLEGLAFEALGASVNWYGNYGHIPEAAVILWAARLCCSIEADGCGFDSSATGLCDFSTIGSPHSDIVSTMQEMCRSLISLGDAHKSLVSLRLLASLLACSPNAAYDARRITSIVSESVGRSGLDRELAVWWEPVDRKLSSLGRRFCECAHLQCSTESATNIFIRHATGVAIFETLVSQLAMGEESCQRSPQIDPGGELGGHST